LSSSPAPLRAPLLWLLLPFMAGIGWGDAFAAALPPGGLRAAAGVALLGGWRGGRHRQPGWELAALAAAALLAGAVRVQAATPPAPFWAATPREVIVTVEPQVVFAPVPGRITQNGLGRIVGAPPHLADLAGQRVYFSMIRKVSVPPAAGGLYRMRGVLAGRTPAAPGSTGFARYLDAAGIRVTLTRGHVEAETRRPGRFRRFCTRSQERLEAILSRGLEERPAERSLYLAMLLGEKAVLAPAQETAFMRSGTFHIFSISGLHVGVIAGAITFALAWLRVPRRPAQVAGLVVLWLYVRVTGGGTPADRAFLMIAFVQGAQLLRLPGNSLAGLAAAALATLLLNPRDLFSAGFQLSYGVVAALIAMGGPLAESWIARWRPWAALPEADWKRWQRRLAAGWRWLLIATATTWTALLASIPGSIRYFGLCSPGALAANLVVVPLSTAIIWTGFAALLAGLVGLGGVAEIGNRGAAELIAVMDRLVQAGADLPGVAFPAAFRADWIGALLLAAVPAAMLAGADGRWERRRGGFALPVLVLGLGLLAGVKFG